ncbi:uncharacterized protein LOC129598464 [Paramacrobiotus metropolitanus]|uniref:uncharacterized protein LOC129598464 n=1 Tax=Paramacrobiotus metropolitanus TaxID=2943436 RepID=UPI002445EEF9|nr:uncharacterized protein LOC129598464 [Paramacrobiotus metropolitanus]
MDRKFQIEKLSVRISGLRLLGLLMVLVVSEVASHISLVYPRARQYPINALNNRVAPVGQCGMPKGNDITELLMGSSFNVTWTVGEMHNGGFRIELLDKEYNLISTLAPPNGKSNEFVGDNWAANIGYVSLPTEVTCGRCVIRVIHQGVGPAWANPPGVTVPPGFRTCADVSIVEQATNDRSRCTNHGTWKDGVCQCDRPFVGTFCEFEEECWDDTDCENGGQCINTHAQFYPKRQCYCPVGSFGPKCASQSAVKDFSFQKELYRKRSSPYGNFTFYWRILSEIKEIEVILEAGTTNWVGFGWRPEGLNTSCKTFPVIPKETVSSVSKDGEVIQTVVDFQDQRFLAGPLHPMSCNDITYAAAHGQYCRVRDLYTRDISTPLPDEIFGGEQSLTAGSCYEDPVTGILHVIFRKKLQASHPTDHSINNGVMHVIWAVGEVPFIPTTDNNEVYQEAVKPSFHRKGELNNHPHSLQTRGFFKINLITGGSY